VPEKFFVNKHGQLRAPVVIGSAPDTQLRQQIEALLPSREETCL
jgi:hypothetical protein